MYRKLTFALLALTLALAACSPAQPTPTPALVATKITAPDAPTAAPTAEPTAAGLTFTDGLGREVKLSAIPQRIISMTPATTEILFAIGAGAQLVGRDEFSDYPVDAKDLPSVGGSMGQYSLEQIAALTPDLVLAGGINTPEQVKAIEDLGLSVYFVQNPTTLEEMFAILEQMAALTGHDAEAKSLVETLQARVATVDAKLAGATEKPVVFYEIDATDAAKPYTAGPGTFIDLLIQRAGGSNLGGTLTDAYPQVSLEQVVVSNPNIIVLGDSMWGTTPEMVAGRPGWEGIDAVKTGKVFTFDDNLVSRPGPRLVDGLEALAKLTHPELFQ